ncbi:MAG TPA: hypothetical protein VJ692_08960 [Nitrospiraceae bacterium]|nr:hypothetical protein [Nitrospiraceae bacterium]
MYPMNRFVRLSLSTFLLTAQAGWLQPVTSWSAQDSEHVAKQMTITSMQDPIPGHAQHQLGMLLPPEDGAIYSGTLTYTASKPVEVVVLHAYDAKVKPDAEHGDVLTGMINGKPYAISVMQFPNNIKATNSATVSFTGSGVALHTLSGEKFTATASIEAARHHLTP